ncbi:MAG: hypothetical protein EZS28_011969 [Streblomastix strix]|uniref:Uncharacterized protein n=1 Tax=Streblomastix strix TaxID=222440 RepID=A0A5J4WDI7_9EUKA|nr:MAG: hypothetical protein EZS28_011969 [Streblomastix strix]
MHSLTSYASIFLSFNGDRVSIRIKSAEGDGEENPYCFGIGRIGQIIENTHQRQDSNQRSAFIRGLLSPVNIGEFVEEECYQIEFIKVLGFKG